MASTTTVRSSKETGQHVFCGLQKLWDNSAADFKKEQIPIGFPSTSQSHLDNNTAALKSTVLYLAYGSNLSAETFIGTRGIKPLSATNVHVPSLDLTFDLAGIPYREPCFANSRWRKETSATDYHKDRWHKGMIGVVYEVTLKDYATIIATEGGGTSYEDVVVDCYAIEKGSKTVDPVPVTIPFKAHTLLCPTTEPEFAAGDRIQRPDPSYAQPSARYLKLITDGGEEHGLPSEYMAYLYDIRPYTITMTKQKIGAGIFLGFWFPIIMALLGLGKLLVDDKGILPDWFAQIMGSLFRLSWWSYDHLFKERFGDGERTIRDHDEELGAKTWRDEKRKLLGS
ncbi:gliotoxin biosynthesis protein [Phlyctema vagabunda]|uniref:gamma-glutamylcyclotransferase n=1 Tax=Phlyctema vagabunda TaxID=108571 RepID=A0ABR4P3N9_9HELO